VDNGGEKLDVLHRCSILEIEREEKQMKKPKTATKSAEYQTHIERSEKGSGLSIPVAKLPGWITIYPNAKTGAKKA